MNNKTQVFLSLGKLWKINDAKVKVSQLVERDALAPGPENRVFQGLRIGYSRAFK
jgi:hypothetical protein